MDIIEEYFDCECFEMNPIYAMSLLNMIENVREENKMSKENIKRYKHMIIENI